MTFHANRMTINDNLNEETTQRGDSMINTQLNAQFPFHRVAQGCCINQPLTSVQQLFFFSAASKIHALFVAGKSQRKKGEEFAKYAFC